MFLKTFFRKLASPLVWGNLLAMLIVLVLLLAGLIWWLGEYTHHGEGIKVPKLVRMSCSNARLLLDEQGLVLMVSDSGYNKRLPADCILAQSPAEGITVKEGHVIYVTVNSPSSPKVAIPDIVDNSSYREAEAKLISLGFKLLPPKRILGERDWVYGILCRGRQVNSGERVSIDTPLTLMIGNGQYGADEDIDYTAPEIVYPEEQLDGSGMDEFEEVDPEEEEEYVGN